MGPCSLCLGSEGSAKPLKPCVLTWESGTIQSLYVPCRKKGFVCNAELELSGISSSWPPEGSEISAQRNLYCPRGSAQPGTWIQS